MIGRLIDWSWLWILAVCCCLLGGLQAFEQAVLQEVPGRPYQPFLLLLKEDLAPQERMELRARLAMLPWVFRTKWLMPEEVLERLLREDLTEEQAALIRNQVPQIVELQVPATALLDRHFDPRTLKTFPQVDRYYWDESSVSSILEERARWHIRSEQMQLALIIASVIIVAVCFLLNSQRNQLRMACEQAGVEWDPALKAEPIGDLYLAGPGVWLKAMGVQALAALCMAGLLFLTFSKLLSHLDTAPPISLAASTDWGFLWAAGCLAAVGKGLDLLRVRQRYERTRRMLERQRSLTS